MHSFFGTTSKLLKLANVLKLNTTGYFYKRHILNFKSSVSLKIQIKSLSSKIATLNAVDFSIVFRDPQKLNTIGIEGHREHHRQNYSTCDYAQYH